MEFPDYDANAMAWEDYTSIHDEFFPTQDEIETAQENSTNTHGQTNTIISDQEHSTITSAQEKQVITSGQANTETENIDFHSKQNKRKISIEKTDDTLAKRFCIVQSSNLALNDSNKEKFRYFC